MKIEIDDSSTKPICIEQFLEPNITCYEIRQGDNKIQLSPYCMNDLIRSCKFLVSNEPF